MCERSTGSCQIISSLRRNRGGASLWNTGLSVFSPGESGPTNSSSIVLRWAASAWAEVGSCGSSGSGMIPVTEARAVWGHCEAVSANWTPVRSTLGTVLGSLWQILLSASWTPCPAPPTTASGTASLPDSVSATDSCSPGWKLSPRLSNWIKTGENELLETVSCLYKHHLLTNVLHVQNPHLNISLSYLTFNKFTAFVSISPLPIGSVKLFFLQLTCLIVSTIPCDWSRSVVINMVRVGDI